MPYVLSLIASPLHPIVDVALVSEARAVAPVFDLPVWLAEDIAAEIPFPGSPEEAAAIEVAVRAVIGARPVDVAVLPDTHRRKRLLVADMDSTIIGQECIDELADLVGLRTHVGAITERAMRGEIAFEPALRERVALLRGLPVAVIDRLLRERIELNPGARTLIRTMRAHGAHTALVSGGFTHFTGPVAERAGFNEHQANELLIDDGLLTGFAVEPIKGRDAKLAALQETAARLGIEPVQTLAVGDGANDLAMIEAAGLGVAYHAKPAVAAAAAARIDHGDLTSLLYLQGYRRREFVE
ncbi:MAG: phosphoserine phosphatase SerB [Bauldia sp.]|nr:phosphoserine phosphatase SerB [Bauldia sp.]